MKELLRVEFDHHLVCSLDQIPRFTRAVEVIVADELLVLVRADRATLEKQLAAYPAWRITGTPPTGHYIDADGSGAFVANGEVVDMGTCAESLGYHPQDFGQDYWGDVPLYDILPVIPLY